MTTLERLLRGDEATWNGYTIINVVDYSEKYDCSYPIYIIYIQDGDIYGTSLNEDNINNDGLITFTKTKKETTIEDGLKVGDIVVNNEYKRKVLAIVSKVVVVSDPFNYNKVSGCLTIRQLIDKGYKLESTSNKTSNLDRLLNGEKATIYGCSVCKVIENNPTISTISIEVVNDKGDKFTITEDVDKINGNIIVKFI